MKKIKKIIATSAVLAGSMVGLTACGEVYISFDTETANKEVQSFIYEKDNFKNKVYDIVDDLTKNGYEVEGVYLDKDFTIPFKDISELKSNTTLYIKWKPASIEVAFDANGGVGVIPSTSITYKTSATVEVEEANLPTKEGYVFTGWNTKADGTGTAYKNGFSMEMTGYEKVTLYAQWTPAQVTITYDANYTGSTEDEFYSYHNYDNLDPISSKVYSRTGYTFTGWNTKADGSGTTYNFNDEATKKIQINALEIKLYAQWDANNYTISYVRGGSEEEIEGSAITSINCDYDSYFTITDQEFSRAGYTFKGWRISGTGDILQAGDQKQLKVASNIELFPVWEVSNLPYDATQIAKLFVDYTENQIQYDYAMVKGTTYTFPNATALEVSNESTAGIATIVDGSVVVNGTGSFRLKLARTSDTNDIWYFNVLVKDNTYTVTYVESDGSTEIDINADGRFQGEKINSYNVGTATNLPYLALKGHSFNGWVLVEPAYIGGEWKPAGTNITTINSDLYTTTIPANSLGNIKLKSTLEINSYSINFYTYSDVVNQVYNDSEMFTLQDYYGTKWTECDNYTEAQVRIALIDNMITNTPNGYVFAGWYTSKTEFTEETEFKGRIIDKNLKVYARYIEIPSAPTGLDVTTSNIITWNRLTNEESLDADSVEYILKVDGTPYETTNNLYDGAMIFTSLTSYELTISAKITFTNSAIGFTNTITTADSDILTKVIENVNTQSIITVKHNNQIVKKIFYTGVEYNFEYTTGGLNDLPTVEDITPDQEIDNIEDFIKVSKFLNEDGNGVLTITVGTDYTGTFVVNDNGNKRLIEVVPNVNTVSQGSSYTKYLSEVDAANATKKHLDVNTVSVTDEYQVGADLINATAENLEDRGYFKFDISLQSGNNDVDLSVFNFASDEYTKYVFYVKDANGNLIDANKAYYNSETNEVKIPKAEEIDSMEDEGFYSCAVARHGDAFEFNKKVAGISYKAVVYFAYVRALDNANTEINFVNGEVVDGKIINADMETNDSTKFVEFDFTLNKGVNVFTSKQLKTAYGDTSRNMIINVHRDIVAELDEEQMHDDKDKTPIHVQSNRVYDNDDTTSNNWYIEGQTNVNNVRKTDGNIFKRASRTKPDDKVVVNGNYCTIDASSVALVPIDGRYNEIDGSGSTTEENGVVTHRSTHNQAGFQVSTNGSYNFVRGQNGIFRYQCPKGGVAIFNSLNIVGNRPTEDEAKEILGKEQLGLMEYEQVQSGAYVGIFNENSSVILNNTNISEVHFAMRVDGSTLSDTLGSVGHAEINYSKFENTFSDGIYGWNGKEVKIFNSIFDNTGGMPVHLQDTRGTNPLFTLDETSKIQTLHTGSEGWYTMWNKSQLATLLKSAMQSAISSFGASALQEIPVGDEDYYFFNPIFVYNPTDASKAETAATYKATTYTGGKKIVVGLDEVSNGKITRNGIEYIASYVYDENGNAMAAYYVENSIASAKTTGDISAGIANSADDRYQSVSGLNAYVFSKNDASSYADFFGGVGVALNDFITDFKTILGTYSSDFNAIVANVMKLDEVKYSAGAKAYEAITRLFESKNMTVVSRELLEVFSLYIQSTTIADDVATEDIDEAKETLINYLDSIRLINNENSVDLAKVDLLWNNRSKTLAEIDDYYSTSGFGSYSFVELCSASTSTASYNVQNHILEAVKNACNAVASEKGFSATDISNITLAQITDLANKIANDEIDIYLDGDVSEIEQYIITLMLNNTTLGDCGINTNTGYIFTITENNCVPLDIANIKLTDLAKPAIASSNITVFNKTNPVSTITARNTINIVDKILYLAMTPADSSATISVSNNLFMALSTQLGETNFASYLMYSFGHKLNDGEDIVLEVVVSMPVELDDETKSTLPMLILCGTGMSKPGSKWYDGAIPTQS